MSGFDPFDFVGVQLNPDGTLTRPPSQESQPNPDEKSGEPVLSKDITLDDEKETFVRVYRPTNIDDKTVANKLPIVMYFRGGGWIMFSAKNTISHDYCNKLSLDLHSIIVHVGFRLAPEHRLPAQYEDGMDAIKWLQKQFTDPNGDSWLKNYGDPSRFYLYGQTHGANITFFCAQRALDVNIEPLKLCGIVMNQPMFGGKRRTKSEMRNATEVLLPLPVLDMLWELTLPKGSDRDHWYCNPMVDGPHKEKLRLLPRCVVIGFGMDPMVDRQQDLVTMLALEGVRVEAFFDDVGFHGIDLVDSHRYGAVIGIIKEVIN